MFSILCSEQWDQTGGHTLKKVRCNEKRKVKLILICDAWWGWSYCLRQGILLRPMHILEHRYLQCICRWRQRLHLSSPSARMVQKGFEQPLKRSGQTAPCWFPYLQEHNVPNYQQRQLALTLFAALCTQLCPLTHVVVRHWDGIHFKGGTHHDCIVSSLGKRPVCIWRYRKVCELIERVFYRELSLSSGVFVRLDQGSSIRLGQYT